MNRLLGEKKKQKEAVAVSQRAAGLTENDFTVCALRENSCGHKHGLDITQWHLCLLFSN